MNITIILFLITGIIIYICLNKTNMMIASKLYMFSLLTILFIFAFITDIILISNIIKLIVSSYVYDFIHYALNNNSYVLSFIIIISIVTAVQIVISLSIIDNKILLFKYKNRNENKFIEYKQEKILFVTKESENNLSLDKVFINYCRMIN